MSEILVSVNEKIAQTRGAPAVVCGNSNYLILFDFDSEWNDFAVKTMRVAYRRNGTIYSEDFVFSGNQCTLPAVYDVTEIAVGVYAGDICTTTPARIPCLPCITDGASVHPAPPQDVYNQLMEYLAGLQGGSDRSMAMAVFVTHAITADGDIIGIAEKEDEA